MSLLSGCHPCSWGHVPGIMAEGLQFQLGGEATGSGEVRDRGEHDGVMGWPLLTQMRMRWSIEGPSLFSPTRWT